MVTQQRGRKTRLILGLIVVLIAGGATAAGLAAAGSGTRHQGAPVRSTPLPNASSLRPLGAPGHWNLVFDDEFSGNSLNRAVWNAHDGWTNQNGVTDRLGNVAVREGHVVLTLSSPHSGAELGTRRFKLRIGQFAQARIDFAGSGSTVYNWPAFWTSGPDWPHGGENDIAEGFGALTVNYHSPAVTHMSGQIPGDYAGGFHVYGIYRGPNYSRIYWDGKVVGAYRTADDGAPQTLLLTLGAANKVVTGSAGAMFVDYVRVWSRG